MQTIANELCFPVSDNVVNWHNLSGLEGRYAEGYFRRVQAKNRPKLVTPENMTSRVFQLEGSDPREFLVCPSAYPELRLNKYDEPCCSKFPSSDTRIKCYKTYTNQKGNIILVPENFVGDVLSY
nr:hypothetical protein Cbor_487 [Cedratvirus borely]